MSRAESHYILCLCCAKNVPIHEIFGYCICFWPLDQSMYLKMNFPFPCFLISDNFQISCMHHIYQSLAPDRIWFFSDVPLPRLPLKCLPPVVIVFKTISNNYF